MTVVSRTTMLTDEVTWSVVCPLARITPETGVAALVAGQQVALFRLADGEVLAIGNHDPFSDAHVVSRGIVGDAAGTPYVASPVFKQRFDLRTGRCLDAEGVVLPTWPVRVADGVVEIGVVPDAPPLGDEPATTT